MALNYLLKIWRGNFPINIDLIFQNKGCVPLQRAWQFYNVSINEDLIFLGHASMGIKNNFQMKKGILYVEVLDFLRKNVNFSYAKRYNHIS